MQILDSENWSTNKRSLNNLRNLSMRWALIFKNLREETQLKWEDTARELSQFISEELDVNYTFSNGIVYHSL